MICPEGAHFQTDLVDKEDESISRSVKKNSTEVPSEELNSFKNLKTWKKSFTNFFRNQLRSTKSNDGDLPSGSKEKFDEKDVSPELKWQSLGKIFRRQSFVEQWNKPPNPQGESSSQSKRLAVRKVLSTYFGKNQKSLPVESDK